MDQSKNDTVAPEAAAEPVPAPGQEPRRGAPAPGPAVPVHAVPVPAAPVPAANQPVPAVPFPDLAGDETRQGPEGTDWRDGVPVSLRFDDPYYSLGGGLDETRHVFLAGNDLPARFRDGLHIAELGFGTGLNLLATVLAWEAATGAGVSGLAGAGPELAGSELAGPRLVGGALAGGGGGSGGGAAGREGQAAPGPEWQASAGGGPDPLSAARGEAAAGSEGAGACARDEAGAARRGEPGSATRRGSSADAQQAGDAAAQQPVAGATGTGPRFRFTSFEAFPLPQADLARALAAFPEVAPLAPALLAAWAGLPARFAAGGGAGPGETASYRFRLGPADVELLLGDARLVLPAWQGRADVWYLDGFSPARNPELWGEGLLGAVAAHSAPGASFATYAAAGHVRRALAGAGFDVSRAPGYGRKRHMSRGWLKEPS